MIINQGNLATLFTGFRASFNDGFRNYTPTWSQLATLVPSSTKTEEYGWLGQFPKLREWIGDRHVKAIAQFGYTIKNKDFEGTVGVDRTDIETDQYGVYRPLFAEMGHAAAVHPDELLYALLAAGFSTTCYDGQYFFDTDHPVGSGTVSNDGGGSGSPWFLLDTRRPLKPLIYQRRKRYNLMSMVSPDDESVFMRKEFRYGVDGSGNVGFGFWQQAYGSRQTLDDTAFNTAYAAMMGFKSDEGRPLGIMPKLLVTGPANRAAALSVIKTEKNAAGASNINYQAVDLLIVPFL